MVCVDIWKCRSFIGMIKDLHLIGSKYGRLTIIDLFRRNNRTVASCLCKCGSKKEIFFYSIKQGRTQSCGCLNREATTKHGMTGIKEYRSWQHMLRRCDDKNNNFKHIYIDKGITVCKEWLVFLNFYEDMGQAPTPIHSIDRIDGNKGYYKENCRWATPTEQGRNTNRNRMIEYKGEIKCMSEWAEKYNLKYPVFQKRLQMGWSIHRALNTPINTAYQRFKTPAYS